MAAQEKHEEGIEVVARNRRARHEYHIIETWEAGLVLTGTEVKSLREGKANLTDAFGIVKGGEVFLLNAHIAPYEQGNQFNHEPTRTRKLLLNKREIRKLIGSVERQGLTLVPLELYFKNGRAKVAMALGKGKKLHDKRDDERKREDERDMARAMRPALTAASPATRTPATMLLPILVFAQLAAAAAAPGSVTVRLGDRETSVPVMHTNTGPALRADLVARGLGGSVRAMPNGHYTITLPGAELDVTDQVPFAKVRDEVLPLVGAPFVEGGVLYVPFQLVAEVIPRAASGVLYDPARSELRVFNASARGAIITGGGGMSTPSGRRRPATSQPAPQTRRNAQPELRASESPSGAPLRRRHLVVVDAGHGGPDVGMRGPLGGAARLREKDVTLAVAQRVAESLRNRGVDVLMTRTTDTLIALSDRGRIANRHEADLFISIHVNAANPNWERPAAARGFETYFLAEAKTEDARRVEQMENESIRFETGADAPAGDPLSFIIADMAQNEHLRESSDLADLMQQGLGRVHPGPSRGVKQANFAVLRTSFMPAVLVEIGFGTNPDEADFLTEGTRQRQLATAIATATVEYLTRYERKISMGQGDAP